MVWEYLRHGHTSERVWQRSYMRKILEIYKTLFMYPFIYKCVRAPIPILCPWCKTFAKLDQKFNFIYIDI